MDNDLLHIVISRVGIYWKHRNLKINWEEYVKNRINLYEKLTKRSLKNETDQEFILLSLYDANFLKNNFIKPTLDNEIILSVKRNYDGSYPWISLNNTICDFVANYKYNYNNVIVTRLDSDDLLHKNFISNVKSNLIFENQYIDISKVFHMNYRTKEIYESNVYEQMVSPFVSIKESINNFKCIAYSIKHNKINKYFKGKKIDNLEAIQVIHENNMINKIRGKRISNFNLINFIK
ncbi:MAG: glycosyltransferase [bacterium]